MRRGQPGVERHGRGLDRQADANSGEDERGVGAAPGERVGPGEGHDVEGVGGGGEVQADEAEEQGE